MHLTLFLQISCNSAERDWKTALEKGDKASYALFLSEHPENEHALEAKAKIEQFDWSETTIKATRLAYLEFITHYPGSSQLQEAESSIDEIDWKEATTADSLQSYRKYVLLHHRGTYYAKADSIIKDRESRVLKIIIEKKYIEVADDFFKVEGDVKNLSEKETIRYDSWINIRSQNKETGEGEDVDYTFGAHEKDFWEVPPLGKSQFLCMYWGMISGDHDYGEGIVSVYATKKGSHGISKRISNIVKIKVNFTNHTASIIQDIP